MNQQLQDKFLYLSPEERIVFLAFFLHELTVAARASYDVPEAEKARKLELVNEVAHFASAKLRDVIIVADRQIPNNAFFSSLFSSVYEGLKYEVTWALTRAFQLTEST